MPDVSVLMPVLNGGAFLRTAIDSLLAQTHRDFELLVIDDGSTDGSQEMVERVRDPRVVLIRNERRNGLSAALNIGLKRAGGEFIARLDADDVAHQSRLEHQVGFLRRYPALALVGSQARLVDETGACIGAVRRPCDDLTIRWYQQFDNPFIHSAVMFRRHSAFEELGGYDESLRLCEDWDLWGRILQRHGACNLGEPLIDYRFSLASITGAIESSPSHPRRPLLQAIAHQLIARHVEQTLGPGAVSDDEVTLMTGFMLGVEASTLGAFLALFDRLLGRFEARHTGARGSEDFRQTIARQFDAIAYRVTPAGRRSALRVYTSAVSHGLARFLPWPRVVALAVLGRRGRDRLRQLRNASLARTT